MEPEEIEKAMEDCADTVAKNQFAISDINEMGGVDHLRELIQAEKDGRLVVLPFSKGQVLLDRSYPEIPKLLKNFRVAISYECCGIIFHQPLNIFMDNVSKGFISQVSKETNAALKGCED